MQIRYARTEHTYSAFVRHVGVDVEVSLRYYNVCDTWQTIITNTFYCWIFFFCCIATTVQRMTDIQTHNDLIIFRP